MQIAFEKTEDKILENLEKTETILWNSTQKSRDSIQNILALEKISAQEICFLQIRSKSTDHFYFSARRWRGDLVIFACAGIVCNAKCCRHFTYYINSERTKSKLDFEFSACADVEYEIFELV